MKNYARITIAAVFGMCLIASTTLPVSAQSTTPAKPVKFSEICQRVKNRLNIRVDSVSKSKDANTALYEGLNKRIEKVTAAAEAKGYDTKELTASLAKTRTAVTAYATANKEYTTNLATAANETCKSETSYKLAITESRALLVKAREAGLAARDAFQYDAVPELRAYKVWLTNQASDAPSDATDGKVN